MDKNFLIYELELIKKGEMIQKNFEFEIPNYILTEMALHNYCKDNVCALINLALINKRITKDNAKILKTTKFELYNKNIY